MKQYRANNLRNIGFIGHSGSGKTTLGEAILFYTKSTDRFGKIEDKNTISDYDQEEKKRKISISTSILPCEWDDTKINILDVPGYFDFEGELVEALVGMDVAVITVSGRSGVKVGTEKCWEYVNSNGVPKAFFINKLDLENSDFEKTLSQLVNSFGASIVPVQYPIGKESSFNGIIDIISEKARVFNFKSFEMEYKDIPNESLNKLNELRKNLIESIAETDEILLENYLENGTLTNDEIYHGLKEGIKNGEIVPVFCGSAYTGIGINTFLENIIKIFPSSKESRKVKATTLDGKNLDVVVDEHNPFSAIVFKTVADPFVGKLSIFKVITGKAKSDSIVYNINKKKEEKFSNIYFQRGKDQMATNTIVAGDIGAIPKLQYTCTGDTLTQRDSNFIFNKIQFPKPVMSLAIVPKSKGDEDKISSGLNKLLDEDLTLKVYRDNENADTIISGLGETHLDVIVNKLKNKFGVSVNLQLPKVPYRETIKGFSDVQGKHKKQSGGHGQYGDVKIRFEPRLDGEQELEFENKIVGGVVPKQYIPAVEKSLKECMKQGVVAGYPVIGLKAILYDGSYHPVDSSEMAFKIAASLAYKRGIREAKPVLLEPIMHVEIRVIEDFMGDIIGDINKRRGRVIGMERHDKLQKIIAEIPMSQMLKYATDLRSITGGRGSFQMNFERYEEVPCIETEKLINILQKAE